MLNWPRSLILSGLLILSLSSCAARPHYPVFPCPTRHAAELLGDLGEQDREVWEWLGKVMVLGKQLGARCE